MSLGISELHEFIKPLTGNLLVKTEYHCKINIAVTFIFNTKRYIFHFLMTVLNSNYCFMTSPIPSVLWYSEFESLYSYSPIAKECLHLPFLVYSSPEKKKSKKMSQCPHSHMILEGPLSWRSSWFL